MAPFIPSVTRRRSDVPEQKKAQFSWSGGEIGPRTLGRSDIDRWQSSAEKMRNWVALPQGGVQNRPGTKYFGYENQKRDVASLVTFTSTTATNPVRLNAASPHGLTTGDEIVITEDNGRGSSAITGISITTLFGIDRVLVTASAGHGFLDGDRILIEGVVGAGNLTSALNGQEFLVDISVVGGASTILALDDLNGTAHDGAGYGPYISGGVMSDRSLTFNHSNLAGLVGSVDVINSTDLFMLGINESGTNVSHSGVLYKLEPSARVLSVPFTYNTDDTYALFFGNQSMMVAKDGALVLEAPITLSAMSYARPGVRMRLDCATPHGFATGDEVLLSNEFTPLIPNDHGDKRYRVEVDAAIGGGAPITNIGPIGLGSTVIFIFCPTGHGLVHNQVFLVEDVVGMPELNGKQFRAWFVDAVNVILLKTDLTQYSATDPAGYVSGGVVKQVDEFAIFIDETGGNVAGAISLTGTVTVSRYVLLGTPWLSSDLDKLDYSQTTDTLTVTCPGYEPRTITRSSGGLSSDDTWTIETLNFIPSIAPPDPLTVVGVSNGNHRVAITSVEKKTGQESLPSETWTSTGRETTVDYETVDGAFEYNIYASPINDPTLGLNGISTSGRAVFNTLASVAGSVTGGVFIQTDRPPALTNPFLVRDAGNVITGISKADPPVITLTDAHGIEVDDIVEIIDCAGLTALNNRFFIVEAVTHTPETVSLKYANTLFEATTFTSGPPIGILYHSRATDTPTAVTYHQQRLVLANTPLHQQAIYMSRSESYTSMGTSVPLVNSDAVSLEIADTEANAIKWLVSMQQLIALTSNGIYAVTGDSNGIITPFASTPVAQYGGGVGDVKPIKYGEAILYVSREGDRVYELLASSDFNSAKSYIPGDISVLAQHLLKDRAITDMAATHSPYQVVWCTRDDGVLLGLTYVREYEVFAWHTHDTVGEFESVAAVGEGKYTGTYLCVKRSVNNRTRRYFERFDNRDFIDIQDAFFVDSGLTFDDANVATADLFNLNPLIFTVTAHNYAVGDFFDMEHKIRGPQGLVPGKLDGVRFKVSAFTATTISVSDLDDVAFDGQEALTGVTTRTLTMHRCVQSVMGLDHLVGETVSILADGSPKERQVVDVSGSLTFTEFHSRIIAGLPIEADLRTLPPDAVGGPFESLQGIPLRTIRASLLLDETIGLKFGPDFDNLTDVAWRSDEAYGVATRPFSGQKFVSIDKKWDRGQVAVRQSDPLPATILTLNTVIEGE